MHEHTYKTAYIGLDVPLTNAFSVAQQQVCERFALIPRPEAHLTIAFFGETSAPKLVALAKSLIDELPSLEFPEIQIDGLGGAYLANNEYRLIRDEEPSELKDFPRVLWLAVTHSERLNSFLNTVKQAAISVGVNTTRISSDFFPHLTLGSAGPENEGDWSLWDVHTVAKRATIDMQLSLPEVKPAKLHLTDVSIQPCSVHLLHAF